MIGKSAFAAAAAGLILGLAAPASADDYPSRPIDLIVPLAPGGSTDVLGRIMAQAISVRLGQPVVVENVAGAAGTIGVTRAERSKPDGYTLLWGMWGTNMANGAIYDLGFDLLNDFEPIALVATQPFFIDARPTMPANNLKELVAWLKANADKATMGTSGVGSPSHIAGVLMEQLVGVKWQMIPYRSAGLATNDLLAGTTDLQLDTPRGVAAAYPKRRAEGLRGHRERAHRGRAQYSDRRRSRIAGFLFLVLACDVGAQGHPAGDHQKGQRRRDGVACRSSGPQAPDRSGADDLSAGSRDAARRCTPSKRPRSKSGTRSSRPPASSRNSPDLLLRLRVLVFLVGFVVADRAARRRAQEAVVTGDVTGRTADDGALDAAFGVGGNGRHGDRQCQSRGTENCFHMNRASACHSTIRGTRFLFPGRPANGDGRPLSRFSPPAIWRGFSPASSSA